MKTFSHNSVAARWLAFAINARDCSEVCGAWQRAIHRREMRHYALAFRRSVAAGSR